MHTEIYGFLAVWEFWFEAAAGSTRKVANLETSIWPWTEEGVAAEDEEEEAAAEVPPTAVGLEAGGRKCSFVLRPSKDIGIVPNIISPSQGGNL